jgi:hypothetical protein
MCFFVKFYFYLNNINCLSFEKKKFFISFSKNDLITTNVFTNKNVFLLKFFPKNKLLFLINFLSSIFTTNTNILFVDYNINYNYLPLHNDIIFNRSNTKLPKLIKYYNVSLIFYFNLNAKKYILKKLRSLNVVHVSVSDKLLLKKFDFGFNLLNQNEFYSYLVYLLVLKTYLSVKNKF